VAEVLHLALGEGVFGALREQVVSVQGLKHLTDVLYML
jgi:hypothetical protein